MLYLPNLYSQSYFLRQQLSAATTVWSSLTPQTITRRDSTQATETARRHALESNMKDLEAVQGMEKNLGISLRWTPESGEWKAAGVKVKMRSYQRCIDTLEGLVVARMFELTKMNMSQTGNLILCYKCMLTNLTPQATAFENISLLPSSHGRPPSALLSINTMPPPSV